MDNAVLLQCSTASTTSSWNCFNHAEFVVIGMVNVSQRNSQISYTSYKESNCY